MQKRKINHGKIERLFSSVSNISSDFKSKRSNTTNVDLKKMECQFAQCI